MASSSISKYKNTTTREFRVFIVSRLNILMGSREIELGRNLKCYFFEGVLNGMKSRDTDIPGSLVTIDPKR